MNLREESSLSDYDTIRKTFPYSVFVILTNISFSLKFGELNYIIVDFEDIEFKLLLNEMRRDLSVPLHGNTQFPRNRRIDYLLRSKKFLIIRPPASVVTLQNTYACRSAARHLDQHSFVAQKSPSKLVFSIKDYSIYLA